MTPTRRLLATAALAALALVAYVVAQRVLPGHPTVHPSRDTTIARRGSARPRMALGPSAPAALGTVGASDHSWRGALAAATIYLQLLDEGSVSPAISSRLRSLTLPPFTTRALRAEATTAELMQRLSSTGRAFVRGWLLGWRIDSHTTATARVAVWTLGTVQGTAEVVAPDWSTTVCSVRWSSGGWRLSGAQTTSGPTPPSDGSDHPAVAAFVSSALRFHPFDDAP